MGASSDFRFINTPDSKEADKLFLDEVDQARHEDGHGGYTGTIAEHDCIEHHDNVFVSRESAESYIDEIAQKWGATIAVRVENQSLNGYYYGGCYSS